MGPTGRVLLVAGAGAGAGRSQGPELGSVCGKWSHRKAASGSVWRDSGAGLGGSPGARAQSAACSSEEALAARGLWGRPGRGEPASAPSCVSRFLLLSGNPVLLILQGTRPQSAGQTQGSQQQEARSAQPPAFSLASASLILMSKSGAAGPGSGTRCATVPTGKVEFLRKGVKLKENRVGQ